MKKTIIFGIVFLMMLSLVSATYVCDYDGVCEPPWENEEYCAADCASDDDDVWCYQEQADIASSCGGVGDGTYSFEGDWVNGGNADDGGWGSMACVEIPLTLEISESSHSDMYVTYVKPPGALPLPILQIKTYDEGLKNATVLAGCYGYDANLIKVKVRSTVTNTSAGTLSYHTDYSCFDGVGYYPIETSHGTEPLDRCVYDQGMWWLLAEELGDGGCGVDADCPDGYICSDEECILGCRVDDDCDAGEVCVRNVCMIEEEEEFPEDDLVDVLIEVPVPPCYETDTGRDYLSLGRILSGVNRPDKCVSDDVLRERYCSSETEYTSEDVSCSEKYGSSWGCDDGECVEAVSGTASAKECCLFGICWFKFIFCWYWWVLIAAAAYYYYRTKRRKIK